MTITGTTTTPITGTTSTATAATTTTDRLGELIHVAALGCVVAARRGRWQERVQSVGMGAAALAMGVAALV